MAATRDEKVNAEESKKEADRKALTNNLYNRSSQGVKLLLDNNVELIKDPIYTTLTLFPGRLYDGEEESYQTENAKEILEILRLFIQHGAGKDPEENARALSYAIRSKPYSLVKILLEEFKLPIAWHNDELLDAPIIHEAFAKMPEALPLLCKHGASIDQQDRETQSTILHKILRDEIVMGAKGHHEDLLKTVLSLKASVTIPAAGLLHINGGTIFSITTPPLMIATFINHNPIYADILKKYIEANDTPEVCNSYFKRMEQLREELILMQTGVPPVSDHLITARLIQFANKNVKPSEVDEVFEEAIKKVRARHKSITCSWFKKSTAVNSDTDEYVPIPKSQKKPR